MIQKKKRAIEWLEFSLLSSHPEVVHGVFLKTSRGKTWTSFSKQEKSACAARECIQQILGCKKLVFSEQIHGTDINIVRHVEKRKMIGDVLITKESELGLGVLHADCQAAIMYDPIHRVIAIVHAGWRGMVKGIYQKTIATMTEKFSTRPRDLLVAIGPSLGPQRAEFIHYTKEFPETFWPFQVEDGFFDLWNIARWQLGQAGIPQKNIEVAELCTHSDCEQFFSYRRDKTAARHATVIALRPRSLTI